MPAVTFLEEERLLIVDFHDWPEHRQKTAIWGEVVEWLRRQDRLLDRIKREEFMMFTELPEASVQDVSYLVQGLDNNELSESDLIEQIENHATETIESVGKGTLQKAVAGGKLLKSVLSLLVRQNFSPMGCLILAHQDGEEKT